MSLPWAKVRTNRVETKGSEDRPQSQQFPSANSVWTLPFPPPQPLGKQCPRIQSSKKASIVLNENQWRLGLAGPCENNALFLSRLILKMMTAAFLYLAWA